MVGTSRSPSGYSAAVSTCGGRNRPSDRPAGLGDLHTERRHGRCRRLALEVAREPALQAWAAAHRGRSRRRDRRPPTPSPWGSGRQPGEVGVGLVEREQRVVLAVHDQGRNRDPRQHLRHRRPLEQLHQGGGRSPLLGGLDVRPADLRSEPATEVTVSVAAASRPEEQGRPALLEGADGAGRVHRGRRALGAVHRVLRHQSLPETVPGVRRHDRIHAAVQPGGQQRRRPTVGSTGEADHRVVAGAEKFPAARRRSRRVVGCRRPRTAGRRDGSGHRICRSRGRCR